MNRPNQEAWQLLGGWAAGILTEKERATLLAAALEDQELFDALADEEALKELLSDEALRLRLAKELEPAGSSSRWTWVWAAGSVLAGLALLVVFRQAPAPQPREVALVTPPAEHAEAPATALRERPAEVRAKPSLVSAPQPVLEDARQKRQRDELPAAAVAGERARLEGSASPPAVSAFMAADAESARLKITVLKRDARISEGWREVGRQEIVHAGEALRVRVTVPGPGSIVLRAAETRIVAVDRATTLDLDLAPYLPGEHTVRVEWADSGLAAEAKSGRTALFMNQANAPGAPRAAAASWVLRVR